MTTESGADSEAKQPQENQETEKGKAKAASQPSQAAAEPASPQNQPEQLPAAVGHSTPARKEQEQQEEDLVSHRSSTSRLSRSPLRGVKKVKIMQCKVTLLDGSDFTLNVEKRAKGQFLFDKVCDHLNLLEKDYFGITYRDVENQKNWLDPSKELKKQIRTGPWNFAFNVKFYPPDPSQLTEDITRYYLCLQLRDDVVSGRLPCSFATHTVLGSYTAQSELGDYDSEELASDYLSELRFAPNQTKELEEKVMELHKTYKGMSPADAEMHFLENAKKLSMYGVDLHHAKDSEGVEIMLGVCASGLLIYRDRLRINRFAWPKILKISYKRNNFYIKIRPGEFEQFESTIGFKLPNHRAAKRLWKVCVEHHTFFRLVSPEAPPKKFLTLGSKFRYSGRTQAQTRSASSKIIRPAPFFERTSSKRYNMSRSLDGAPIMENHETLMKDSPADGEAKVIAKGDIITTVTTEKKAEEEKAEEGDAKKDTAETPEPAATSPLRQDTKPKEDEPAADETKEEVEPKITESTLECVSSSQKAPAGQEEKPVIETEALPAKSAEPTVNIQTTEAVRAEQSHPTAELTAAVVLAEAAKRVLDYAVMPQSEMCGCRVGDEESVFPDCATFLKNEPRASLQVKAERQPVAKHLGVDENAGELSLSTDVEVEAPMLKNGNDGFSCNLPVYISGCGKKGELPLTEEEPDEDENKRFLDSLEKKFADFKRAGEKKHTEVNNRRVQFSDEVQFFKEEFPVKTEDGMKVDEEVVECFPVAPERTEDDSKKLSEMSNRLPFEKEKYYHVKMKSPEDETEEAEDKPLDVKKAAHQKYDKKEVKLQKMEENESEVRGDMMASEEIVEGKALEKETEARGRTSPHKGTRSELLRSHTPASNSPSAVPRLESPDTTAVATKDMPVIHTETKTITYEAAEVETNGDADPGVLLSAQTITSETTSTTTTTHITKTVKGGISETRIEKRIVITGDADIDHDEALAQAIKEAKEQHPDMSVTKVVVHKETEITPEEGED
ncbi:unnamed protein product [Oreochromis niloticus]|nr:unnamed protein product [Mustela putorius furo]